MMNRPPDKGPTNADGGAPSHKDTAAVSKISASATKPADRRQPSLRGRGAVAISHGQFSSRCWTSSPQVARLIRSTVSPRHREYDPAGRAFVIFASQVDRLLAAFDDHGVEVTVVDTGGEQR